jgi:hypothetical protein
VSTRLRNLDLGEESIPPGEMEAAQRIITLLKQRLTREYPPDQKMLRDAHPKAHGLLRAEFIVEPDLPDDLRIGVFSRQRTYPAWIRFSNMRDPPQPDIEPDSRGMAIKVMDVGGEKILEGEKQARTQDFVLMSSDYFVTKGAKEFADLVEALERGTFWLLMHFVMHPRLLLLFLKIRQKCASVLETRFGSTTPYLFGERAVKYSARPHVASPSAIPRNPSPNFLREQMAERLHEGSAIFEFCIQFQTDVQTMPIEDPRCIWSETESPPVRLATIVIPPQKFDTPERNEYGDNLAFTPWHCLPEHRPLGGINRARRLIYETMSHYRRQRNSVSSEEPDHWHDS